MATKKGTSAKKEKTAEEIRLEQLTRLVSGNITLDKEEEIQYLAKADDLGILKPDELAPVGFKRCGQCQHTKKFYLFNKNSGSKTDTTGNCKECQRASASKSYAKTKKKRNYRKYYAENKEMKQEQARKYYEEHKDEINAKHKKYLSTKAGQAVMRKAHAKRAEAIANHKGIPYTREIVLDRDKRGGAHPICYLCGNPILDTSGAACHLDHVVSIGNGGLDCFTNIAAVHQTCNLTKEKDDRNLTVEQISDIIGLAETYMDAHPELFQED